MFLKIIYFVCFVVKFFLLCAPEPVLSEVEGCLRGKVFVYDVLNDLNVWNNWNPAQY
jgi:hypothetical protein